MDRILTSHNTKVLKKAYPDPATPVTCNCRDKTKCPLHGKCLATAVVYKATVTSDNTSKSYIGLVGGSFKLRYNNHTKSFRNKRYQHETELSKYIWDLKNKNIDYSIYWEIIRQSNTFRRDSGLCNLCMDEKLEILLLKNKINKRTELISTCRHGGKPRNRAKKKK